MSRAYVGARHGERSSLAEELVLPSPTSRSGRYGLCEHHILPFFGRCHIGYFAKGKVIGASKLARIVDLFAQRLQIQERLTNQIARAVMEAVGAQGVGVVIEAQHLCMMMRGVEKQNSLLTTSSVLGSIHDSAATRTEFLTLVSKHHPA